MVNEIINQSNWVDILILAVILRIIYIAFKQGLIVELFKVCALVSGVFISLHYFTRFTQIFHLRPTIPADFIDTIFLVTILVFVLVLFHFIRQGILVGFKVHPVEILDKWGAVILGIGRATLVASVILLVLYFSTINYLRASVVDSFSGKRLLRVAPQVYEVIFTGVVSKFFPREKMNAVVFDPVEEANL